MKKITLFAMITIGLILVPALLGAQTSEGCQSTCAAKSCALKTEKKVSPLTCPVCSLKIEDKEKAVKLEHKGKTLYFMSETCKESFVKNPEKYLKDCCKEKDCAVCPNGCKQKADKAGKCPECGAEMKKMDHSEKAACCQAVVHCAKKHKK